MAGVGGRGEAPRAGRELGATGSYWRWEGETLWTEGTKAFTENFLSDEGATGALPSSLKQCHLS